MTKVAEIVRDALGHLRVLDMDEAVEAEDCSDAIRALNLMMSRWAANGLVPGWSAVSSPDDVLPAPPEAEEAIGYSLALRLSSRYAATLDEATARAADLSVSELWRDRLTAKNDGSIGDIIRRALRLVRAPGGLPDELGMTGAVEALNAMMRRWEANGISVGWSDVSAPTDKNPLPPEADEAVAFNLAALLATEYGVPLSGEIAESARNGKAALIGDVAMADAFRMSYDLPRPENGGRCGGEGYCG